MTQRKLKPDTKVKHIELECNSTKIYQKQLKTQQNTRKLTWKKKNLQKLNIHTVEASTNPLQKNQHINIIGAMTQRTYITGILNKFQLPSSQKHRKKFCNITRWKEVSTIAEVTISDTHKPKTTKPMRNIYSYIHIH